MHRNSSGEWWYSPMTAAVGAHGGTAEPAGSNAADAPVAAGEAADKQLGRIPWVNSAGVGRMSCSDPTTGGEVLTGVSATYNRPMSQATDAVVVGGGPNGLAAGIVLARAGRSVSLFEARDTVGGGCRSAELTLPGVAHDVCSAVHPLARPSPLFRELGLERHGLEWIEPPIQLAHPLDDGSAALVWRDIDQTAASFEDDRDARRYARHMRSLSHDWELIVQALLGPLRPLAIARHPFALARFGLPPLAPAAMLAGRFRSPQARALMAGTGAHSFLPLSALMSGGHP